VASFIEIPPLSTEILSDAIGVNGRPDGTPRNICLLLRVFDGGAKKNLYTKFAVRTTGAVVLDVDVSHSETIALTQMTLAQIVFTVLTAYRCVIVAPVQVISTNLTADRCVQVVITTPITAAGGGAAV